MSRLTRDGTAEPVSRDQILTAHADREIFIFPAQLTTSRIGNRTQLIHILLHVMTMHTYGMDYDDYGCWCGVDPLKRSTPKKLGTCMGLLGLFQLNLRPHFYGTFVRWGSR